MPTKTFFEKNVVLMLNLLRIRRVILFQNFLPNAVSALVAEPKMAS